MASSETLIRMGDEGAGVGNSVESQGVSGVGDQSLLKKKVTVFCMIIINWTNMRYRY